VLADNFTLAPFSLFIDHLRLAADEGDFSRPIRCQWAVMSHRREPVRASCGVPVGRSSALLDPRRLDYIVVIGGLLHPGRAVDDETIAYLHAASRVGTTLIGICTGSFILCRAGLMKGRPVCVSWYHYQDFVEEFPHHEVVADRLYLVDGDRITCAGGGGAADLATHLVERHIGRSAAQKSRQIMLLDQARAENVAQPHPPVAGDASDNRVRRAMLLMEQHLSNPLPIGTIATRLDLSPRQLERLFHAAVGQRPGTFYRALRLRYARWLLDNTQRSVTDIALDAGFSDCAHFSRQFKTLHGFSPSAKRGAAQPQRSAIFAAPNGADTLASHRVFD
jgi:transcriptional regulator GlxA family with amidase domain